MSTAPSVPVGEAAAENARRYEAAAVVPRLVEVYREAVAGHRTTDRGGDRH